MSDTACSNVIRQRNFPSSPPLMPLTSAALHLDLWGLFSLHILHLLLISSSCFQLLLYLSWNPPSKTWTSPSVGWVFHTQCPTLTEPLLGKTPALDHDCDSLSATTEMAFPACICNRTALELHVSNSRWAVGTSWLLVTCPSLSLRHVLKSFTSHLASTPLTLL